MNVERKHLLFSIETSGHLKSFLSFKKYFNSLIKNEEEKILKLIIEILKNILLGNVPYENKQTEKFWGKKNKSYVFLKKIIKNPKNLIKSKKIMTNNLRLVYQAIRLTLNYFKKLENA